MVRLQNDPIETDALMTALAADEDGAVALFVGRVRDHHGGRRVLRLEYHAYDDMAEREMERLHREALDRFRVTRVGIVHRCGSLAIGEASVAVAVASHHRADAFEACRWVIDTLKQTVPIWKKEFFEDGESWVEGGA